VERSANRIFADKEYEAVGYGLQYFSTSLGEGEHENTRSSSLTTLYQVRDGADRQLGDSSEDGHHSRSAFRPCGYTGTVPPPHIFWARLQGPEK
jgi:hypothetical protein